MCQCSRLYNAALESFRNSHPRRWATVPAAPGKGLSFDGHAWQRNVATGVWFNEVSDRLKVTGHEVDASLYAMYHEFVGVRADDADWAALDTMIGRGVLQRLERAKNAFFRRCRAGETPGYPRFKSGSRWRTIEMAAVRPGMVRGNRVRIKGLPTITIRGTSLPGSKQLKTLHITRVSRRVTVSLGYEVAREPLPPNPICVGIDMGVTDRMTFSNGDAPIERRESDRENIAEKQGRMSRCRKGEPPIQRAQPDCGQCPRPPANPQPERVPPDHHGHRQVFWAYRHRGPEGQEYDRLCQRDAGKPGNQRPGQEWSEPGDIGADLGSDTSAATLQGSMGR